MKSSFDRIDIHSHVYFPDYDSDRDEVVRRAFDARTAFISVGTGIDTSKAAIALADKYEEGAYAIVGLHPVHSAGDESEAFDVKTFKELVSHPRVVGIGECGLDYFRSKEETKTLQKQVFIEHIELAMASNKALMLHIREAYDDALDILKAYPGIRGNAHFFAGTIDQARRFLDLGFTLSFTGVITFAKEYRELVSYVPLDMIQAETDSPYVTPVPHRGTRNEPVYVKQVIDKIADIKKLSVADIEAALMANARRVWGIDI